MASVGRAFLLATVLLTGCKGGQSDPRTETTAGASPDVAPAAPAVDLAAGNPAMGEYVFKRCASCHTADKGAASGIGPNLYGVVGRKQATMTDYTYSPAMMAQRGVWDAATLDRYLASPVKAVPGNRMTFAGIPDAGDRVNLIAWLATRAD